MKEVVSPLLALALTTSAAFAGGPVAIEEEPVVEAEKPRSGWVVPVIVGGIILCAIACGDDDDDAPAPTGTTGGTTTGTTGGTTTGTTGGTTTGTTGGTPPGS